MINQPMIKFEEPTVHHVETIKATAGNLLGVGAGSAACMELFILGRHSGVKVSLFFDAAYAQTMREIAAAINAATPTTPTQLKILSDIA